MSRERKSNVRGEGRVTGLGIASTHVEQGCKYNILSAKQSNMSVTPRAHHPMEESNQKNHLHLQQ